MIAHRRTHSAARTADGPRQDQRKSIAPSVGAARSLVPTTCSLEALLLCVGVVVRASPRAGLSGETRREHGRAVTAAADCYRGRKRKRDRASPDRD